jgi:hypothetical protein
MNISKLLSLNLVLRWIQYAMYIRCQLCPLAWLGALVWVVVGWTAGASELLLVGHSLPLRAVLLPLVRHLVVRAWMMFAFVLGGGWCYTYTGYRGLLPAQVSD